MGHVLPKPYKALVALENTLAEFSLSAVEQEYIRIRASQINGCGYCLDEHFHDALQKGADLQKLVVLAAWREAGDVLTTEEKLIVQITEEVTIMGPDGLPGDTYEKAIALMGQTKVAEIIMCVGVINIWNRIGVSTHLNPVKR